MEMRRRQADADRQRLVLLEQARHALEQADFSACLAGVSELLQIEPDHPEAAALKHIALESLARRSKVEELLACASGYQKVGDYKACLYMATRGLELEPGDPAA